MKTITELEKRLQDYREKKASLPSYDELTELIVQEKIKTKFQNTLGKFNDSNQPVKKYPL